MVAAVTGMSAAEFNDGKWTLSHENSRLDISYGGKEIFANVFASSTYNMVGDPTDYTIVTNQASAATFTSEDITDEFGSGKSYVITCSDDRVVMKQRFNIYPGYPYMIVGQSIESRSDAQVESRRMVPFASNTSSYPLEGTSKQRILWVPFDNESHTLRYKSSAFGSDVKSPEGWSLKTSSEVSAIFDPDSRVGVVIGSVDHDTWKSGISIEHKNGGRVPKVECLSGWTDYNLTKDLIAHGKVKGRSVASARYMVGVFDDWRDGMDQFGEANNVVAPRFEWTRGNPVGWSSWGNQMQYINYDGVYDSAEFMKNNLFDLGFHDREGKISISLDSFNGNIGDQGLYKLGTKVFGDKPYKDGFQTKQGMNMNLGMYGGMVVWSWTLGSKIPGTGLNGTRDYTWGDVVLKVNGDVYGHGSDALAIDPTHPAVRANLEKSFADWALNGTKYVKMDFMNAAVREGDSWYDPNVTTGIQAYNYGMKIVRELAEKYDMYVVLAMSPLFPYQYAHGRRTCCDRWGRLEESEFVMNAISYGWWTDRLYTVNDPDQMTMCQNGHNASETMGENRVRATTGMATGAFIFGDTFSDRCYYTDDNNGHQNGQVVGYPAESRKRAIEIMGNNDINQYVRENTGSFRPVEGGNPSTKQESEKFFVRETDQYIYLAVFNWSSLISTSGTVKFDRLGIDKSNVGPIKELWSGQEVAPAADGVAYSVPKGDTVVYRITKLDYDGVETVVADADDIKVSAAYRSGQFIVTANSPISIAEVYDLAGAQIASVSCQGSTSTNIEAEIIPGTYIVSCRLANGVSKAVKLIVR